MNTDPSRTAANAATAARNAAKNQPNMVLYGGLAAAAVLGYFWYKRTSGIVVQLHVYTYAHAGSTPVCFL